MGVPQGGPLSPLLANIALDPLDKELERKSKCAISLAADAAEAAVSVSHRLPAGTAARHESPVVIASAANYDGRDCVGWPMWVVAG